MQIQNGKLDPSYEVRRIERTDVVAGMISSASMASSPKNLLARRPRSRRPSKKYGSWPTRIDWKARSSMNWTNSRMTKTKSFWSRTGRSGCRN
jgi:hypothetical protein